MFVCSDFRIVSHLPFACNWQTRFLGSEPVVARFLSNTRGTSDIQIPCQSVELNPTPCMCVVCCVHRLGPSHMLKQNVLSLILLILLAELTNQKRGFVDTAFCTPNDSGPRSPMLLEF